MDTRRRGEAPGPHTDTDQINDSESDAEGINDSESDADGHSDAESSSTGTWAVHFVDLLCRKEHWQTVIDRIISKVCVS